MQGIFQRSALSLTAGLVLAASAQAIDVTANITTSTTWTADNVYNLTTQIYVTNGATLTIEPGTLIASAVTANGGGALAVTRGSQIHSLGTRRDPVIFTSEADVATWTGGDPKTGTWREAANEWGNLTIMGRGFISENAIGTNSPTCNANNVGDMEGLVNGPSTDRYGGGNDNDDSGTLRYTTFRYGGRVVGLTNELNGLSLGGIGRGTDIHHIEIMNNVDDGIEIWGGTVNLKYFSIWNIGDDSFDVDQGWRGKAQFGLIVQGYSLDANQGSGVGDNCFEVDGAEQSDWQPVTTATIYNCTVIGQPFDGDHATAWRDGARVQYRQCIFEDIGDDLVAFDNIDGDGGLGYGNGSTVLTLTWPQCWNQSYTQTSTVNPCPNPAQTYQAQTSGRLCEIADSVFFNIADVSEAIARGVFNVPPGNDNSNASTLAKVVRAAPVLKGGKVMSQVVELDPRPAAALSINANLNRPAPDDGFFTPVSYRGAFAPGVRNNWLYPWSASHAFGFLVDAGDLNTVDVTGSEQPCTGPGCP